MAVLLTLAGQSYTGGSFTGGAVVQLDESGAWSELAAGNTIAWNLQNFVNGSVHTLWHIRSNSITTLNNPDRGKLYRSADQGASWTHVTPQTGAAAEFARDIAQDADGDLWLITDEREAPTDTTPGSQPSRIYKSEDDGVTWALKYTTVNSFINRFFHLYSITCHPTDPDTVLAEGVEMVALRSRLWRTMDGGDTWTRFTPTVDSPPLQVKNIGGAEEHVFDYTVAGDLVWAGIFENANDDLFILRSTDDGDNWDVFHTEAQVLAYGTHFHEKTLIYVLHAQDVFEIPAAMGANSETKIADRADSPFIPSNVFHGFSRHAVDGVDTLHLGVHEPTPNAIVTEDPSIFTRPADLGSGWVEHVNFSNMDSDLGYRLYVAMHGVVGATEVELPPTSDPDPPDEPPGGGGPIGAAEPGVGDPAIGEARRPRVPSLRGKRGRRGFKAGPIGHRLPPAEAGEPIDKRIPDEYEEPLVRKWLTFGWLTAPMLEGQKTITLRDWGPTEGVQWKHGELFYAYDMPPVEGGRRLALLRVMQEPFMDFTAGLTMADYHKLGYSYAMANRLMAPSGRTALEVWEELINHPQRLWLLRFAVERVFEQGRKERGTVKVGVESPIAR